MELGLTYEELLEYEVYEAIKLKAKENIPKNETFDERMSRYNSRPSKIPNNPLLLDYDYVYEHAEEILVDCKLDYQGNQSSEAYYILFKVLRDKYPLEDDYNNLLYNRRKSYKISRKWSQFATHFISFFNYAFDERLEDLFNKEDFVTYLARYPDIFDKDTLEEFSWIGLRKCFEHYPYFAINYLNKDLIRLMRKNIKLKIPHTHFANSKLIKAIARTPNIIDFHFKMNFIEERCSGYFFYEEHRKYCDEQVSSIRDGILPFLQNEYEQAKKYMLATNIPYYGHSIAERQVIKRIFDKSGQDKLPKKFFYQELSKYYIIGMFLSRNFDTDPHNLLIDIETLYEFALENNRPLKGLSIYSFLTTFEDKSINEIISFYQLQKRRPLKDILYDDWQTQKETFVEELNQHLFNPSTISKQTTAEGITYYDISNTTAPILVHNTSTPIDKPNELEDLIERVKTGYMSSISLSIHDENHQEFYKKEEHKKQTTIKFIYGPLDPARVGIIYHEDAYSQGTNNVEWQNFKYTRRLYTLKSLMDETERYNELVYTIAGTPVQPLGIICEDKITPEEIQVANTLGIDIFLRQTKEKEKKETHKHKIKKSYSNVPDHKKLFT